MVERMAESLGLEVWDHPEERRRVVGEALARWDEGALKEALWAYLVRHRKKPDRAAPHYVGYFVRWLALKGRRWPHLEPEDPKAFLLEAKERGFPGGERGPLSWGTVERARASLRHLFPFLDWAGHPMPSHVRLPSRQELPVVAPSRAMPEEAYQDLLEKAGAYPLAYWRPLLRVLLVLLGEVGLTVKEAVELWQEDVREKVLLVRGAKLREVPLSPLAREVLADWLPQRAFLASHQPLPYPHLLLKPAPGKNRGKPLGLEEAKWILTEFADFAGVKAEGKRRADLALPLRWRAIRRFLKEGHPREKVAYWTGMKSLVVPGWGEVG